MFYVAHAEGGTYSDGHAYKIYQVTELDKGIYAIEKPIAGVYFSLRVGTKIYEDEKDFSTDNYQEAVTFIMHDCIKNIFKGDMIFQMNKLAKEITKKPLSLR